MLTDATAELVNLDIRDLPWARTYIAAVNSGNSLLRTDMMIRDRKKR